jgi:sugar phosphate isomerase/epimerase
MDKLRRPSLAFGWPPSSASYGQAGHPRRLESGMLSAMKAAFATVCLLLMPGLAMAQGTPRAQIGVCLDPDKFDAAQAAGFDYVETNASKVAALTDEEFQKLATQVAQLKIPLAASMSFVPGAIKLTGPDVDPAKQMTYVTGVLGRLKRLGVKVVVLGSGGARRVPDGFSKEEASAQLVDFCRRIAPVARENGITIVIEPLRRQETNIINTAREGLALVRAVDRPEIKLLVDYYHLAEEGENADVIAEAGPLLAHAHIANPKGRVYPLSLDESPYSGFFSNLCKIGYQGRLSVEASTTDFATQAPQTIALLRTARACGVK